MTFFLKKYENKIVHTFRISRLILLEQSMTQNFNFFSNGFQKVTHDRLNIFFKDTTLFEFLQMNLFLLLIFLDAKGKLYIYHLLNIQVKSILLERRIL